MDFDKDTILFHQIFRPDLLEHYSRIVENNMRFVYYTSASTAINVISNGELWFRNASVMNDFSEITYGIELLNEALAGEEGTKFKDAVDSIFPGTYSKAIEHSSKWSRDWISETYIACVSVHDQTEDNSGRLSMWRAYGNTALVVNNTPMTSTTDALQVFSLPVKYLSSLGFKEELSQISINIINNKEYLSSLNQDTLISYIHEMFHGISISTKHPGFAEEKEWRMYYRPSEGTSPAMTAFIEVIGGVPQKVYKLKLAHDPENGLHHADVPTLLDRIIVGPTAFPDVAEQAFISVLTNAHVPDPLGKVIVSDIPLRVN